MPANSATTLPAIASSRGMLLGVAAYTLFAIHDALVKSVISDLPVFQILFVRSVVIAALCLAIGRRKMVATLLTSGNKHMILLRAVLTLAAWCMYYSTGRQLQLAQMTTLYYFAPVLTTVLAVVFLKERLTLARVGAAALGFFGVVVACNPAGFTIGWPAMLVLAAAFCWSVAMILMRTISKTESSLVQIFALNLFYVVVMGIASISSWQAMDTREIAVILAAALVGGAAQYILVEAARQVPASVLGTVEYSALIWSFVFGYLFWHEQPAVVVFVGAGLVIAAGIILAGTERNRRPKIIDTP